ncbi:hypothetical protein LTR53_002220 [Teratosphaeriaceae sp. CCFEE 6253]|nr:hypothetical protein LTR53_002220 [Teratosphaeriaceae sp. CCFEE 6253]
MTHVLHQEYTEQMKRHGYGHAFYEPKSSNAVKPGAMGYIDEGGNWTPLFDLGDESACARQGFTKPRPLDRAPVDLRHWGPKVSEGVRSHNLEATGGISAQSFGIPVEATATYKFSSSGEFGAMLMCSQPVKRENVYHPTRLVDWVKDNARAILSLYPDVKRHGFFLVTTTYHVTHAWINAWTSKEKEVVVGFKAQVVDVGEVAPSSQWDRSSFDQAKDGDGKVVFFGGIYFAPRRLALPGRSLKTVHQDHWRTFRGEHQEALDFEVEAPDADGNFMVECKTVGDLDLGVDEEPPNDEEDYF